jgi:hypothetical protein
LSEITWKQDSFAELFDCVSYPQRVWSKKKDDCDGFAVLAATLLNRWDPQTRPVIVTAVVTPLANGHSVCVFQQGGGFRYFSNAALIPGIFQSYGEIVANFSPPNRLLGWDVVKPDTLEQLEFHVV